RYEQYDVAVRAHAGSDQCPEHGDGLRGNDGQQPSAVYRLFYHRLHLFDDDDGEKRIHQYCPEEKCYAPENESLYIQPFHVHQLAADDLCPGDQCEESRAFAVVPYIGEEFTGIERKPYDIQCEQDYIYE